MKTVNESQLTMYFKRNRIIYCNEAGADSRDPVFYGRIHNVIIQTAGRENYQLNHPSPSSNFYVFCQQNTLPTFTEAIRCKLHFALGHVLDSSENVHKVSKIK